MLLYLVKHSRPDIANAVRELSKVADGATEAHWKALLRVIKYVLSTENIGLKIKPTLKKNFYIEGISDSELQEIKIQGLVSMLTSCIFVEHQLLGNPKEGKV